MAYTAGKENEHQARASSGDHRVVGPSSREGYRGPDIGQFQIWQILDDLLGRLASSDQV